MSGLRVVGSKGRSGWVSLEGGGSSSWVKVMVWRDSIEWVMANLWNWAKEAWLGLGQMEPVKVMGLLL